MVSYYRDNITCLEDMIIIFLQTCISSNNSFIYSLTMSSTRHVSTHTGDLKEYNHLYLILEMLYCFLNDHSISHAQAVSLSKRMRTFPTLELGLLIPPWSDSVPRTETRTGLTLCHFILISKQRKSREMCRGAFQKVFQSNC